MFVTEPVASSFSHETLMGGRVFVVCLLSVLGSGVGAGAAASGELSGRSSVVGPLPPVASPGRSHLS